MKMKSIISGAVFLFLFSIFLTGSASAQANLGKAVIHFGGSYNKAMIEDAKPGFFGVDVYAGKMLTNALCVGFSSGYDIVHYHSYDFNDIVTGEPTKFTERIAVIPIIAKVKYYFTFSPMVQVYGGLAGGAYRVIPTLGGRKVGDIRISNICPGGSVSIGLDYWFLLTTGVGFEFEYHMFSPPDGGDLFKYWSLRVDYSLIKF